MARKRTCSGPRSHMSVIYTASSDCTVIFCSFSTPVHNKDAACFHSILFILSLVRNVPLRYKIYSSRESWSRRQSFSYSSPCILLKLYQKRIWRVLKAAISFSASWVGGENFSASVSRGNRSIIGFHVRGHLHKV